MNSPFRRPLRPGLTARSFFWANRLGEEIAPTLTAPTKGKKSFLERAWAWLHATFPERQIYIRSDGRVQFFTFGPRLQATLAGLSLIFLGWVAFATVNVVFKDRIIAAKDHHYQQMQTAYEARVTDLQSSYNELNGALVSAEDRFKATADALSAKQNAIKGFLDRATRARASVKSGDTAGLEEEAASSETPVLAVQVPGDAPKQDAPSPADASSTLVVLPGPAQPQPRTDHPVQQASLIDHARLRLSALFRAISQSLHFFGRPLGATSATARHPALRALAQQTARLATIGQSETLLMARTQAALDSGIGELRAVMRRAGINPDGFARKMAAREGVGGPEIPLDQVRIEGISDPGFTHAYLTAMAVLDQLDGLSAAMAHVPLATPVSAVKFEESSGFGPRIDPFTGRYAFHPGVDFAGPWGSLVYATAAGTVVFAGPRGGYGNMVEIDHGFGIHTRYGHLSAISVRVGAKIARGQSLGRVGSTGRSTGSHVHYEVWYDDVVKNPNRFLEAGHHVL